MVLHDGDGWVDCRCGQRHWGRHGAAGLVLARTAPASVPRVGGGAVARPWEILLQLRAGWVHQGGTWAVPGGALDSHEGPTAAALREAWEEAGVDAADVVVLGERPGVEHVDWRYTYVVAVARRPVQVTARTTESEDLRWLEVDEVAALPLHPAFATAWPELLGALPRDRAEPTG